MSHEGSLANAVWPISAITATVIMATKYRFVIELPPFFYCFFDSTPDRRPAEQVFILRSLIPPFTLPKTKASQQTFSEPLSTLSTKHVITSVFGSPEKSPVE
jgi:hypothetical protein